MSPANIFRHFSSKADLAYAVIAGRLTAKSSSVSPMGEIGLKGLLNGILNELIEFLRKEPRLYAVLATMVSAEDAAAMLRQRLLLDCITRLRISRCPASEAGSWMLSRTYFYAWRIRRSWPQRRKRPSGCERKM
jgi:AcrR family transcriptional regulator